jgi:hypothetical protein
MRGILTMTTDLTEVHRRIDALEDLVTDLQAGLIKQARELDALRRRYTVHVNEHGA